MSAEYQTWTFPRETIDEIAREFREYFERRRRQQLTPLEASMMIDYVNGPSPAMTGDSAMDYSRVRVTGGSGYPRPSDEQIEAIYTKYEREEEPNVLDIAWDAVFDELLASIQRYSGTINLINMTFRDGLRYNTICEELNIGQTTFYRHRRTILEQAGMIAHRKGLLNH